MTQAITKPISFEEFVKWYPEDASCKYELHDGNIFKMPLPLATGTHSNIIGLITGELHVEIRRLKLPYRIPGACLLKPFNVQSGYQPDIIVLKKNELSQEPRWQKESIITLGSSIQLVVEVVSQNWQNDYLKKVADYEIMGISEYWIVDHLGLGGRRFIGEPKSPTLSVYQMVEGEYDVKQFHGDQPIESLAFSEFPLTPKQIFEQE